MDRLNKCEKCNNHFQGMKWNNFGKEIKIKFCEECEKEEENG